MEVDDQVVPHFADASPHRLQVAGLLVEEDISESHISTYTWPEMGYAALDIYTCGTSVRPDKAVIYAVEAFGAETSHITEITRGIDEGDSIYYHSFITWEEDLKKSRQATE